jgi:hypothetical protein
MAKIGGDLIEIGEGTVAGDCFDLFEICWLGKVASTWDPRHFG